MKTQNILHLMTQDAVQNTYLIHKKQEMRKVQIIIKEERYDSNQRLLLTLPASLHGARRGLDPVPISNQRSFTPSFCGLPLLAQLSSSLPP
jgi:hypothetical protein